MFHVEDDGFALVIVDPVEDAVGAAAGRPDFLEVEAQGFAHSVRSFDQSGGEEIDGGGRDGFG